METSPFEDRMKSILESELLRACRNGDKDTVAQLVDDKDSALDCSDASNGLQPLMVASRHGHFEIVKYLLWHNTDILDNTDAAGWSSLHWSILNGHYLITKELIEFGADLDLKSSSDGIYPLHLAIFYNETEITELLLQNNCRLDILYNDLSITELLNYLQFKSNKLDQDEVDTLKQIIFNSNQYKQSTKTAATTATTATTANTNTIANINTDDEETPIWKKYLDDKSPTNDEINDSNDSNDLRFDSSDEEEDEDVIGDIMSILQKDDLDDEDDDALNNTCIIEEEEEFEEEEEENEEKEEKEIVSQKYTETKTTAIANANNNVWNNSIISINVDALSQSLSHMFVNKTDFDEYSKRQCQFNEQMKSEQCQSLKEVIEVNTEINDITNEWKTEAEKIRNETKALLDTELTKYELWIKSLMSHFETMINENLNEIESLKLIQNDFQQRQNKMRDNVKIIRNNQNCEMQNKRISIETLKVGKIIEMELNRQENNNNTMSLTQSFSEGIHGPRVHGKGKKHERASSLRINIQQNIFNANALMQPLDDDDGDITEMDGDNGNDDHNDILCTVEAPLVTDSNGKTKPKRKPMRRKRSNSYHKVDNQTIVFWD